MFGDLSFSHILILLLVLVLVFGAKRIPEIGSSLGKGIKEFQRSLKEATGSNDQPPAASPPRAMQPPASPSPLPRAPPGLLPRPWAEGGAQHDGVARELRRRGHAGERPQPLPPETACPAGRQQVGRVPHRREQLLRPLARDQLLLLVARGV